MVLGIKESASSMDEWMDGYKHNGTMYAQNTYIMSTRTPEPCGRPLELIYDIIIIVSYIYLSPRTLQKTQN